MAFENDEGICYERYTTRQPQYFNKNEQRESEWFLAAWAATPLMDFRILIFFVRSAKTEQMIIVSVWLNAFVDFAYTLLIFAWIASNQRSAGVGGNDCRPRNVWFCSIFWQRRGFGQFFAPAARDIAKAIPLNSCKNITLAICNFKKYLQTQIAFFFARTQHTFVPVIVIELLQGPSIDFYQSLWLNFCKDPA